MEHPVRASSKRIHSEKPGIVLLDRPLGECIFFGLSSGRAVGSSSNFHMNKNHKCPYTLAPPCSKKFKASFFTSHMQQKEN